MKMYLQFFGGRGASFYSKRDIIKFKGEGGKSSRSNINPVDISKIKDKSLAGIEKRIRPLKREQLYAFDEKKVLKEGYRGNATGVNFPPSLLKLKNGVVTHNHPTGYEGFGGTFSPADIRALLRSDWKELRATASGQGEMNYILRKTDKATKRKTTAFLNALKKNEARLFNEGAKVYREEFNANKDKGQAVARKRARQKFVGILDKWYKDNASKYGYSYVKRKK